MTQPWFLEYGNPSDPLLLCLHGIGSCGDAFKPQASLAADLDLHLVAWDAPGYRNSPDPDQPYTLDDWADAAAALITDLGHGQPAVVLGVSWGGVTATRLTLRHPELVGSLILADSSGGSGTTPERSAAMRARATAVDADGLEAFATSRAPLLLAPDAPKEVADLAAKLMIDSVRQPSYTWACASMGDTDHSAVLHLIDVPTLVILGDQDQVTPRPDSDALHAGITGSSLVVVPDAGHLANQEQPEVFNDEVRRFLSALRAD